MICAYSSSMRISSRSEVISLSPHCSVARSRSARRDSSRSARGTSTCISAEIVFSALKKKCGRSCALRCASCASASDFCSASSRCCCSWALCERVEAEDQADPQADEQHQLDRLVEQHVRPGFVCVGLAEQRVDAVPHGVDGRDERQHDQRQPLDVLADPQQRPIEIDGITPVGRAAAARPRTWPSRATCLPTGSVATSACRRCGRSPGSRRPASAARTYPKGSTARRPAGSARRVAAACLSAARSRCATAMRRIVVSGARSRCDPGVTGTRIPADSVSAYFQRPVRADGSGILPPTARALRLPGKVPSVTSMACSRLPLPSAEPVPQRRALPFRSRAAPRSRTSSTASPTPSRCWIANWRMIYMNKAARRTLREQGMDPDTVIGRHFWDDLYPGRPGHAAAARLRACHGNPRGHRAREFPCAVAALVLGAGVPGRVGRHRGLLPRHHGPQAHRSAAARAEGNPGADRRRRAARPLSERRHRVGFATESGPARVRAAGESRRSATSRTATPRSCRASFAAAFRRLPIRRGRDRHVQPGRVQGRGRRLREHRDGHALVAVVALALPGARRAGVPLGTDPGPQRADDRVADAVLLRAAGDQRLGARRREVRLLRRERRHRARAARTARCAKARRGFIGSPT